MQLRVDIQHRGYANKIIRECIFPKVLPLRLLKLPLRILDFTMEETPVRETGRGGGGGGLSLFQVPYKSSISPSFPGPEDQHRQPQYKTKKFFRYARGNKKKGGPYESDAPPVNIAPFQPGERRKKKEKADEAGEILSRANSRASRALSQVIRRVGPLEREGGEGGRHI